jgi:hypothetical protein
MQERPSAARSHELDAEVAYVRMLDVDARLHGLHGPQAVQRDHARDPGGIVVRNGQIGRQGSLYERGPDRNLDIQGPALERTHVAACQIGDPQHPGAADLTSDQWSERRDGRGLVAPPKIVRASAAIVQQSPNSARSIGNRPGWTAERDARLDVAPRSRERAPRVAARAEYAAIRRHSRSVTTRSQATSWASTGSSTTN